MAKPKSFVMQCPIPKADHQKILMAHGGGGKLMHQLIEKIIGPAFSNKFLDLRHDGAVLPMAGKKIAFTTDSYVVHPLFFPGGDIGSMAVYGTVNDLAMCGAKPLYLSVGFIIEEGLDMGMLQTIVSSMRAAAERTKIKLVTGDTKVVDRGKGDGIFINTAGIGAIEHKLKIIPSAVKPGDRVLINGDLGRHGMAIMAKREGLSFESQIESDSAPVADLVLKMISRGIRVHCLRDLTRGGLASALNEIALAKGLAVQIRENKIPVREDVRGACEILGLDPIYVANEGRFAVFVPEEDAERTLSVMKSHPLGRGASLIGEVKKSDRALVTLINTFGTSRIVDMLSGEQLPRIC